VRQTSEDPSLSEMMEADYLYCEGKAYTGRQVFKVTETDICFYATDTAFFVFAFSLNKFFKI
jgi:hypothetical protein